MNRRMTSIGITALCALTAAAVTASGATAGTPVTQGNAAFTCIEGAGAHNTNGDCQPGSTGSFGHKGIAEGVSTGLALDKLNNPVLVTKIGLVTVTLTGKGPVDCIECMAENRTDPGTGVMDVTGTGGRLRFTEVAVSTSNCGVKSVTGDAGVVETEPLKLTTLSPTKATIEPAAGDVVAEFNFTGASCPLTGSNPIKIKGHADGTLNGAVIKFETDTGELTIGTQVAHLNGEATATAGVTGAEYHPVALTAN